VSWTDAGRSLSPRQKPHGNSWKKEQSNRGFGHAESPWNAALKIVHLCVLNGIRWRTQLLRVGKQWQTTPHAALRLGMLEGDRTIHTRVPNAHLKEDRCPNPTNT